MAKTLSILNKGGAMDRKAIEDHVTDYVEGKCNDAIQHEMDRKRQQEPDFDSLVRMHEYLLSVLKTTPIAAVPDGLSEKILSAIHQKEKRLAEEQKRYHRETIMLISMGVLVAAFTRGFYNFLMDGIMTMAYRIVSWFSAMIGTPSVSAPITRWLDMTGGILDHHIQLPLLSTSIPTYIIVVTAMLIGVIWHYHDYHIQIG